jgi:cold shock protein
MAGQAADGYVDGTVTVWHAEDGWGVVTAPGLDGNVWVHFSVIAGPPDGYRGLRAGQPVQFTYEAPGQDGFPYSAIDVVPV